MSRPEGIERDELVARFADLLLTEDDARYELLGMAQMSDGRDRVKWLKEAADGYRAASQARRDFRKALLPDDDTAIGGEARELAEAIDRDRLHRKHGLGKYAKPPTAEAPR